MRVLLESGWSKVVSMGLGSRFMDSENLFCFLNDPFLYKNAFNKRTQNSTSCELQAKFFLKAFSPYFFGHFLLACSLICDGLACLEVEAFCWFAIPRNFCNMDTVSCRCIVLSNALPLCPLCKELFTVPLWVWRKFLVA